MVGALRCEFVEPDGRCSRGAVLLQPFCDEHFGAFSDLSNPDLIAAAAEAMKDCLAVINGKIGLKPDGVRLWSFGNHLTALRARGYSHMEAMQSVCSHIKNTGILNEVLAQIEKRPKWRRFEKVVAAINRLRCEGASVVYDEKIVGRRTGRKRQCDVTLRFSKGYYEFLLVIECRDKAAAIKIEEVEAFSAKLEDVGAQKGVMVSAKGFQAGAVAAAKAAGIDLYRLEELKSDWSTKILNEVFEFPFPVEATFHHGECEPPAASPDRWVGFYEIIFSGHDGRPCETLVDVFSKTAEWLMQRAVELPALVKLEFEGVRFMQVPGVNERIPVAGMDIRFEPYCYHRVLRVDLPPSITHYRYSSADGRQSDAIAVDQLAVVD